MEGSWQIIKQQWNNLSVSWGTKNQQLITWASAFFQSGWEATIIWTTISCQQFTLRADNTTLSSMPTCSSTSILSKSGFVIRKMEFPYRSKSNWTQDNTILTWKSKKQTTERSDALKSWFILITKYYTIRYTYKGQ